MTYTARNYESLLNDKQFNSLATLGFKKPSMSNHRSTKNVKALNGCALVADDEVWILIPSSKTKLRTNFNSSVLINDDYSNSHRKATSTPNNKGSRKSMTTRKNKLNNKVIAKYRTLYKQSLERLSSNYCTYNDTESTIIHINSELSTKEDECNLYQDMANVLDNVTVGDNQEDTVNNEQFEILKHCIMLHCSGEQIIDWLTYDQSVERKVFIINMFINLLNICTQQFTLETWNECNRKELFTTYTKEDCAEMINLLLTFLPF